MSKWMILKRIPTRLRYVWLSCFVWVFSLSSLEWFLHRKIDLFTYSIIGLTISYFLTTWIFFSWHRLFLYLWSLSIAIKIAQLDQHSLSTFYHILSIFLLFCLIGYIIWVFYESKQAYFSHSLQWYQKDPQFLPIQASIISSKFFNGKISELNDYGLFIFFPAPIDLPEEIMIELRFKKKYFCSKAKIVSIFRHGMGIEFKIDSQEQKEQLWDFLENIKLYGYLN